MASTLPAPTRATRRRSLTRPAALPLRFELLEDRSLPSFSFPLLGGNWNEMGPRNIAVQPSHTGEAGQGTSSPGGLASTGRISDAVADPNNINVAYVTTASGGVWKTTDYGETWRPLTDRLPLATTPGLTDDLRTLNMGGIALSPIDSNIVYAGEGEQAQGTLGHGILKSLDGGATWRLITGPGDAFEFSSIPQIIVLPNPAAPTDPTRELVFALVGVGFGGAGGSAGIWRSDDGGETWLKITPLLNTQNGTSPFATYWDMAVDPTNPNIAYVSYFDGSIVTGIYRTTNALSATPDFVDPPGTPEGQLVGTPWTVVFGGVGGGVVPSGLLIGRINFVLAPSSPSTLYVFAGDGPTDGQRGVYRSQDRGTTWREYGNVPTVVRGQESYNMAIAVDPTNVNRLVLSGLDVVAYTSDALNPDPNAVTWTDIARDADGQGPHVDHHTITFTARDQNGQRQILAGSDGGMFRTRTFDTTGSPPVIDWESANGQPGPHALNATQFVGIALHPSSADELVGGTQDNGTIRFFDDGAVMTSVDLTDKQIQVPEAHAGPTSQGGDGGDAVYDPTTPETIYTVGPVPSRGTTNWVTKSTDGGRTWAAASNGIGSPEEALFYPPIINDPSLPERVFVGTDAVYETTDFGASWHRGPTDYPFPAPIHIANDLPFVTGALPNNGQPGAPSVVAMGLGRSDPYTMYVAVDFRVGPNFSNGPALYRINVTYSDPQISPPSDAIPWRDVSPIATGSHPIVLSDFITGPLVVGDPMPPIPSPPAPAPQVPTDPQSNDLSGGITNIAVDPFDSNIVYVTTSGHQIWQTFNGGSTWRLMSTQGLPTGPLQGSFNDIVIDPNLLSVGGQIDDVLYVATEIGVYTLSNPTQDVSTQVWTRVGGDDDQNTPGFQTDASVSDLELNTATGILAAGTYGRGVWEFQIRPYISGIVFDDTDGDGIRDENGNGLIDAGDDKGIPDIEVVANRIEPAPPFQAANTKTLNDPVGQRSGFYVFRALENGTYDITIGVGTRLPVDPNNPFYVSTPPLNPVLDQNSTIPTADIGVFRRVNVTGVKFNDRNTNGVQDANELGLPGWTFQLYDSANPAVTLATAVSDGTGAFTFTGLGQLTSGGQFRIREIGQAGWVATTAADQPVPAFTSGQNITGILFGNVITGSLLITGWPDPATTPAGIPVTFTLTVRDQFNNVFTGYRGTVRFTTTDGGTATTLDSGSGPQPFPLDYTFTAADAGLHAFTVVFTTAGPQSLSAVSATDLGITGTSAAITVTAGAASQLRLLGLPASVVAGQVSSVTVTAADAFGNQTAYTGPVAFTATDPAASLPSGAALTNGIGVFGVVFRTAGNQSLTVSDPANVLSPASASTRVDSAAGSQFFLVGVPATTVAGTTFVFTVRFLDPFGNPALGPVHFTVDDPLGTVPGDYLFTAADGGEASFTAAYRTAGTRTLTVSSPNGTVTPATGTTLVTAAATAKYTVGGFPTPVQVGTTGAVTVTATDAFGNLTSGTVTVNTTDAKAVLPGQVAVTGSATFNVTFNTAGTQAIAVTDGTASGSQTGIEVTAIPPPPPPPPPPNPVVLTPIFAIGSDAGPLNFVRVYNQDQTVRTQFQPFDPGHFGGVRVATAVTPTGTRVVAAPGPSLFQDVKVFDSDSPNPIRSFPVFESSFSGGLFVSTADFNGDGWSDYIFSPDEGGGPVVKVVDGQTGGDMAAFFGIEDPNFRGGARTAAADVNGDGVPDLLVAAGFGGGPRIAIFDGKSIRSGGPPVKLVSDFFVFEQTLRNGVYIGAGDLNGDGFAEVIAGGGPGGAPRVFGLDGKSLMAGQVNPVVNFFAGDPASRGGVRVTVKNLDNDDKADLLVGSGPGVPTRATAYAGTQVVGAIQPPELFSLDATLGAFAGGVFVG
ncbi:MAG TPA: SdrD B-like domain-containing protein [Fimbriiglobus sp.]|nr:SdrD B-like domain-containing protein [Fimbriiglobus sp.]